MLKFKNTTDNKNRYALEHHKYCGHLPTTKFATIKGGNENTNTLSPAANEPAEITTAFNSVICSFKERF